MEKGCARGVSVIFKGEKDKVKISKKRKEGLGGLDNRSMLQRPNSTDEEWRPKETGGKKMKNTQEK